MLDSKVLSRLVILVGATVSVIALTRYLKSKGSLSKSELPYPPGPKDLPLIGNVLDLPRDVPILDWFAQMAETYRMLLFSLSGELMIKPLRRDGYHLFQHVWNRPSGFELKRDHRWFTGQEVGDLLGQGNCRVSVHICLARSNATGHSSTTNSGTDEPEPLGVHGVQIRRKVEDPPSVLPRILQRCDRGYDQKKAVRGF